MLGLGRGNQGSDQFTIQSIENGNWHFCSIDMGTLFQLFVNRLNMVTVSRQFLNFEENPLIKIVLKKY